MSNTILYHRTPTLTSPGWARLLGTSPETPQPSLKLLMSKTDPALAAHTRPTGRLPTSMKGNSTLPCCSDQLSRSHFRSSFLSHLTSDQHVTLQVLPSNTAQKPTLPPPPSSPTTVTLVQSASTDFGRRLLTVLPASTLMSLVHSKPSGQSDRLETRGVSPYQPSAGYSAPGLRMSPREKTQDLIKTDEATRGRDLHSPLTSCPPLSSLICTCQTSSLHSAAPARLTAWAVAAFNTPPWACTCTRPQFPRVFLSKCHLISA